MRLFVIVLLGLIHLIWAKPTFLPVPLTHATSLASDTQMSINGRVLDNADVARRERANLVDEYLRSVAPQQGRQLSPLDNDGVSPILMSSAPLGADGRVVDTPEVAAAKAAHATAHVNEKINLANEAARSNDDVSDSSETATTTASETVVGPGNRVLDAPEVIRTAHTVEHVNEKINVANEATRPSNVLARVIDGSLIPLVFNNDVVAALVPVGSEGRPLNTPEVVVGNQRSIDALAIAGPALAYGRLIY